jgi:tetratricopeptide (TPR) repeat protein
VIEDAPGVAGYEITDGFADRYNLARARYNLREFDPVERELALLVPAMDKHIGGGHDRTIKARSLWAQTLAELGRYQQAIEVEQVNLANARAREASDDEIVSLQELTLAKLFKLAMRPHDGLPLARHALVFFDTKYGDPIWFGEIGRRLVAELLLEDGQVDEAIRTLAEAEGRSRRIDGYAAHPNFADLLQAKASALRVRGKPGDTDAAVEFLQQARAINDRALGPGNTASLRCEVQVAWLLARGPNADSAAEQRFLNAASAYDRVLPAGHLARAELEWIRAELGTGPAASLDLRSQTAAHQKAAREAWKATLGIELHTPLSVLH